MRPLRSLTHKSPFWRTYGSWPDLVNRPVIMGQYVLASLRDGSQISSELQVLREKQGYQVPEPGDLVESPQFAALLFLLSAQ